MEQWEFNRLVIHGTEKELNKAMQEHPDLMDKCAEEIQARLWESPLTMDDMDYQRLVDRRLEEVEEYNITDDI